jgi:NADH-quinone oxidoreductase subunit E
MPRRSSTAATAEGEPAATVAPSGRTGETPGREAADARVAAAGNPAERAGAADAHPDAPEPAGPRTPDGREGTDTPAGTEPGTSGQGPAEGKA